MKLVLVLIAAIALAQVAYGADVRVSFFDDGDQKGDAASYTVTVTNACTSCQGFGFRLKNSWESVSLSTAAGSNYTLYVFDSGSCDGKQAAISTPWGNIPGIFQGSTLKNSVDSWKVCPPGKTP